MEEKFNELVNELEKRNVPCKVSLNMFAGKTSIIVEVGKDSPEDVDDRAFEAINACKLDIGICGEHYGGQCMISRRVCGGPKRYFNGKIWR